MSDRTILKAHRRLRDQPFKPNETSKILSPNLKTSDVIQTNSNRKKFYNERAQTSTKFKLDDVQSTERHFLTPPVTTKNLAANRLKRLRSSLEAERLSKETKSPDDFARSKESKIFKVSPMQERLKHARNSTSTSITPPKSATEVLNSMFQQTKYKDNYNKNVKKLETIVSTHSSNTINTSVHKEGNMKNFDAMNSKNGETILDSRLNVNNLFVEEDVSKKSNQTIQLRRYPIEYVKTVKSREKKFDVKKVPEENVSPLLRGNNSFVSGKIPCFQEFGNEIEKREDTVSQMSSTNNSFISENVSKVIAPNLDEDVDMEWDPIDENEVISDIRLARETLQSSPKKNIKLFDNLNVSGVEICNVQNVHIVVDTNVFIHKLQIIPQILDICYEDGSFPIIFVPWMVIQELDYFKEGYSNTVMKQNSQKAIKFINDCLMKKKDRFKGQSVHDASENKYKTVSPDDSIINCCIQVAKSGKVMLLSSDINLRNKALFNNIDSYSPEDIMRELRKKKTKKSFDLIEKVSASLSLVFSYVIDSVLKESMDDILYSTQLLKELPWSFRDCIFYLKEYYPLVFKLKLQKQSQKVINDLLKILDDDQPKNETIFFELCLSLLIYMKTGLSKFERNIDKAILEIKQIEIEKFVG